MASCIISSLFTLFLTCFRIKTQTTSKKLKKNSKSLLRLMLFFLTKRRESTMTNTETQILIILVETVEDLLAVVISALPISEALSLSVAVVVSEAALVDPLVEVSPLSVPKRSLEKLSVMILEASEARSKILLLLNKMLTSYNSGIARTTILVATIKNTTSNKVVQAVKKDKEIISLMMTMISLVPAWVWEAWEWATFSKTLDLEADLVVQREVEIPLMMTFSEVALEALAAWEVVCK